MRIPRLVVLGLFLFSAAAIAFALFYRGLLGMAIYDTHFQRADAVYHSLTREQADFFDVAYDYISASYSVFLILMNALWAAGSIYLLCKLRAANAKGKNA